MINRFKNLLCSLIIIFCAFSSSAQFATPTYFAPIPMEQDRSWRIFTAIDTSFLLGRKNPLGSDDSGVTLNGYMLDLGVVYSPVKEFQISLAGHAGLEVTTVSGAYGADLMVRYLPRFNDIFYGGFQGQLGYNANCLNDLGLGYSKNCSWYHSVPISLGIVGGIDIKEKAVFYLFPAVQLGQTTRPKSDPTKTWKDGIGLELGLGAAFDVGLTNLVFQVRPLLADIQDSGTWGLNMGVAAYWDF